MKNIIAFGVAALVSLSLVGCGTGTGAETPEPTPTVTVTVTPTPEPEPTQTELTMEQKETVFLDVVRDEYPQYNDSRTDLLEIAAESCAALDRGLTGPQVRAKIDPNASNSGYLFFIIGAAVGTFCPEHTEELLRR